LVGALSYFLKKIWNPVFINQLAYESEKYIHVRSSGVDPAAVVSGGLIWYRRELDFLRSVWQLPFGIPKELNNFCFIDTGRPIESTGDMVSYVGGRLQKVSEKSKIKKMLDENEKQTKTIAAAIKGKNEKMLIGAFKKGEKTLEELGVVSSKVVPFIRKIEKLGGAAKILGGGGRAEGVGYLLCYHRESKTVKRVAKSEGFTIQHVQLGEEGVRLEKI